NSSSPSFYRGGFFYSAMGNTRGPLVDHNALRVDDPSRLQITHLAYSQAGKVAFTGYYNDYRNRADQLAGLWTADLIEGVITNLSAQPVPDSAHGIADLQWSPDGNSLVYRETMAENSNIPSSYYNGISNFSMVKFDPGIARKQVLYSNTNR
ncbi:MAG TPA: hypothetical protein VM409_01540, partial [Chloroflexia bacterium]|nr:hypothetical protein [Chloroflexia bacterium]